MSDTSDKTTKSQTVKDLRFVRVMTPYHIPRKYIENIKHREFEIDDLYKTMADLTMIDENTINPLNHLYVIADKDYNVKGFLWFTIEPMLKAFVVQNYSLDKEYWGNGENIEHATEFLKSLCKKLKIQKAYWNTRYPKVFEKHGFRRSKNVLMEYDYGTRRSDGQHHSKASPNTKPSAASLEKSVDEPSGGRSDRYAEPVHSADQHGELSGAVSTGV